MGRGLTIQVLRENEQKFDSRASARGVSQPRYGGTMVAIAGGQGACRGRWVSDNGEMRSHGVQGKERHEGAMPRLPRLALVSSLR